MVKAPETEAAPPVVKTPVPVFTAPLLTVLRFTDPLPLADRVKLAFPEGVWMVAAVPLPIFTVVPVTV